MRNVIPYFILPTTYSIDRCALLVKNYGKYNIIQYNTKNIDIIYLKTFYDLTDASI